jgi:hypothetical protein
MIYGISESLSKETAIFSVTNSQGLISPHLILFFVLTNQMNLFYFPHIFRNLKAWRIKIPKIDCFCIENFAPLTEKVNSPDLCIFRFILIRKNIC